MLRLASDSAVPKLENILPQLSLKFAENVTKSLGAVPAALEPVEIKARATAILGELIGEDVRLAPHQSKLGQAFDEVFTDLILSSYLGASCLDNPACIVLRRALETGVAIAYLWDSPCAFYGWTAHDKDLSFKSMVEFLASDSYKTLLSHENPSYTGETVIDVAQAESLYRAFSNITHGKWTTFESALPDRFSHNASDWTAQLIRISDVQDILLNLWKLRFPVLFKELISRLPALEQIT
jgi:hypothetical protein